MPSIHVELGKNSYPIIVDQGILYQLGELLRPKAKSAKVIVIADAFVSQCYGTVVSDSLSSAGFDLRIVEVPAGEEHKSLEWFGKLHDRLIDHRMDRDSTLIALGGGLSAISVVLSLQRTCVASRMSRSRQRCWRKSMPASVAKRRLTTQRAKTSLVHSISRNSF